MNDNYLYYLMIKRIGIFNITFILLFCLLKFVFPFQIIFYCLVLTDLFIIIIELIKKTHYPVYCYIYSPLKILFEWEDKVAIIKRNKNIYYILLMPLIIISFIKIPPIINLSIGLSLPFIMFIILLNLNYILKIYKYKAKTLKAR